VNVTSTSKCQGASTSVGRHLSYEADKHITTYNACLQLPDHMAVSKLANYQRLEH